KCESRFLLLVILGELLGLQLHVPLSETLSLTGDDQEEGVSPAITAHHRLSPSPSSHIPQDLRHYAGRRRTGGLTL
ncbi:hypothetical protein GBAR_LOCUS21902, partial [Geodia barretti]